MSDLPPVVVVTESAEATRDLGRRLGTVLRAGDVVILSGELGAGKTTLAQGLGAGLGIRGEVTSPTFVISRVHPAGAGGLPLVHVDAYRLDGCGELDDLDIDAFTDDAVTVVEWGEGLAEALSPHRLHVDLSRSAPAQQSRPDSGAEPRVVTLTPIGDRWVGVRFRAVLGLGEGKALGDGPAVSRQRGR